MWSLKRNKAKRISENEKKIEHYGMAWRLHAKFKNLKGKALKRQWKIKILPPPRKENAKAREAAALEEGGFAVHSPRLPFGTRPLYLKPHGFQSLGN